MKVRLIDYIFASKEVTARHLGLVNINEILKANNFDSEVIKFNHDFFKNKKIENQDIINMANYILKEKPKFIGLSTLCTTFHITLELLLKIKEISPNTIVFLGGPHSSLTYDYILKNFKEVDFIMVGESEDNILDTLKNYQNSMENEIEIEGVAYIKNNNIIYKESTQFFDLEKLNFFDNNIHEKTKQISLEGGRGCPFNCSFCCTNLMWKRTFRLKPINILIKEIEYYYEKFGVKKFNIEHDLFIYNKKEFFKFCDKLIEKKLNKRISWSCSSRVDLLSEEIIKKMKKSGCTEVFLGIESASDRIQKKINKNLDLNKIYKNLSLLKKYDIPIIISLIYGFPFEEKEDFDKTVKFAHEVRENYGVRVGFFKLRYYPKSDLTLKNIQKLKFDDNFFHSSIFQNRDIKNNIIKHKEIFSEFYTIDTKITEEFYYFDTYFNFVIHVLKTYFNKTYNNLFELENNNFLIYKELEPHFKELEKLKLKYNFSSNFEILKKYFDIMSNYFSDSHESCLKIFLNEGEKYKLIFDKVKNAQEIKIGS